MTKAQKNVVTVLRRLADSVAEGTVDAKRVGERLDDMLNDLMGMDEFGTEGQLDPRGDWRDGPGWSVTGQIQK